MKIKYYYSIASPFSYLAIDRFINLLDKKKIEVDEKPFDLVGQVFPNTGGIPVPVLVTGLNCYSIGIAC